MRLEKIEIKFLSMGNTAWVAPTLLNNWANYGYGFNPAGYMKDANGFVHLRGLLSSGTVTQNMFVLPTGFRPANRHLFVCATDPNVSCRVDVKTDGSVVDINASNVFLSLDNIVFKAA